MTARSVRRALRLLPVATAFALAAACDDVPDLPSEPDVGTLADVIWFDDTLAAGDVDTCGPVAVLSDPEQDLRVALVAEDRVFVPEVTPPADEGITIGNDWLTKGGCVPTAAGAVVVVEAQEAYANLYDEAPKVVAGFTPEGEQLWSAVVPGAYQGNFEGRGSIVYDSLDDSAWTVLDARTGAVVASGRLADGAPVVSLGPTLVDDVDGGLVDLASGRRFGREGDSTAQVDDGRMLLQTVGGLRLVRLPDLRVVWRAQEDIRLTGIWTEAADLSTSTVVAFATDGTIVGLDLASGRMKWTSDVPRDEVNGLRTQVGSGVVVFRRNGRDPLGQVVLDSATGQELAGADGYVIAGQEVLLRVASGAATPVTVDDLR